MNEVFKRNMNKMVASLAVTVGLGAVAYNASAEKQVKPEVIPPATATAQAAGEFDSTSDGQGVAEGVIKEAVEKALTQMNSSSDKDVAKLDIHKVVENLPVYDQAAGALEMSGYDEILPDQGDVLKVSVDVSLDADQDVSYDVTDAVIEDKSNNQE